MNRVSKRITLLTIGSGMPTLGSVLDKLNRELIPALRELIDRFNDRTGDVQSVTADYQMLSTDRGVQADSTGAAVTVTLPTNPESRPWVMRANVGGGAITIEAPSGATILGYPSGITLAAQYDCVMLDYSAGTWVVISAS